MSYTLVLDILVASLLVVTIVYCVKLSRNLKTIRDGQTEIPQLFERLDGATRRAEASVGSLKEASVHAGTELEDALARARTLTAELKFMMEAGNNLADRLAAAVSSSERAHVRNAANGSSVEGDEDGSNRAELAARLRRVR